MTKNILSLFDGMSCGQIALQRAGIPVNQYFASEIDKHAIKVTQHHFPNTIQLGSVTDIYYEGGYLCSPNSKHKVDIDMIIGGSPCQSFSFSGKRNGMTTTDKQEITTLEHYLQLKKENYQFEGQSYLFWEYVRLLQEVKPKYFFMENVVMEQKWENVITRALGVKPILLNSSLLSAQNRRRLYWTNIAGIQPPEDKGIMLKDIIEDCEFINIASIVGRRLNENGVRDDYNKDVPLSQCLQVKHDNSKCGTLTTVNKDNVLTNAEPGRYPINKIIKECNVNPSGKGMNGNVFNINGKSPTLTTNKGEGIKITGGAMRGRYIDNNQTQQQLEIRHDGKSNALTTVQKTSLCVTIGEADINDFQQHRRVFDTNYKSPTVLAQHKNKIKRIKIKDSDFTYRTLTVDECCRLQTVDTGWFNSIVSDSQAFKMLGNGWTIDIIAHCFSYIDKLPPLIPQYDIIPIQEELF